MGGATFCYDEEVVLVIDLLQHLPHLTGVQCQPLHYVLGRYLWRLPGSCQLLCMFSDLGAGLQ